MQLDKRSGEEEGLHSHFLAREAFIYDLSNLLRIYSSDKNGFINVFSLITLDTGTVSGGRITSMRHSRTVSSPPLLQCSSCEYSTRRRLCGLTRKEGTYSETRYQGR